MNSGSGAEKALRISAAICCVGNCVAVLATLAGGGAAGRSLEPHAEDLFLGEMVGAACIGLLAVAMVLRQAWPTARVTWALAWAVLVSVGGVSAGVLASWLAALGGGTQGVDTHPLPILLRMPSLEAALVAALVVACSIEAAVIVRHRSWPRAATLLAAVSLSLSLTVAVGYGLGLPPFREARHAAMTLPNCMGLTLLSLGVVLNSELARATLLRFLRVCRGPGSVQRQRFSANVAMVFCGLFVLLGLGGAFLLASRIHFVRQAALHELTTVADVKSSQIAAWYEECLSDARVILGSPLIQEQASSLIQQPDDASVRGTLASWAASMEKEYGYGVSLFGGGGGLCLGRPEAAITAVSTESALESALYSTDVVFQDLHFHGDGVSGVSVPNLCLWVPVRTGEATTQRAAGAWRLVIDPRRALYPMLREWPVPSATAETLLFRREANEVLYLSELRHRSDAALKLRRPADPRTRLVAAMAVAGETGPFTGVDYRGVPVMAVTRHIGRLPWIMVAKVDLDELYAPLWFYVILTGAGIVLVVVASGTAVGMLGHKLENAWLQDELRAEREYRALADRVVLLTKHANDIILFVDEQWRIADANDKALVTYGYAIDEIRGLRLHDLHVSEECLDAAAFETKHAQESDLRLECVHRRKDGTVFLAESSIHSVSVSGASWRQVVVRDVTEQRRIEQVLQEMTQRLRLATESGRLGVWDWDIASGNIVWNDRMFEIYGIDRHQAVCFDLWFNAVHAEDRAAALEDCRAALRGERDYDCEFRVVCPDGTVRTLKGDAVVIRDERGEAVRMIGLNADISEQKASKAALQREKEFTRAVLENIADGVVACDEHGTLALFNKASREWHGMDALNVPAEEYAKHYNLYEGDGASLLPLKSIPLVRAFSGEQVRDANLVIKASGQPPRYVLASGGPLYDEQRRKLGAVVALHDVTARREMEQFLIDREQDLAAVCENVPVLTLLVDADRRVRQINATALDYAGIDFQRACGMRPGAVLRCVHAADSPAGCGAGRACNDCGLRRIVCDTLSTGLRHQEEVSLVTGNPVSDQQTLDFLVSTTKLELRKQPVVLVSLMDITGRVRAEKERIQLQTGIEQAAEAVMVADMTGPIRYVNPAMEIVTGYSRLELLGKDWHLLLREMEDVTVRRDIAVHLGRGEVWKGHGANRRKDGSLYQAEITMSPVRDASGAVARCVMILRDATREMELESRLLQAQKLEAIGTLAGGIAHDFNNMLQALLGYADLLEAEVEGRAAATLYLKEIQTAGQRATDLVGRILAFSRRSERQVRRVNVHEIVEEALKLLRGSLPSTIDIVQHLDERCPTVLADPMQLHQVVMNLCTNAYHAMRDTGGVLEVRLEGTDVDARTESGARNVEPGRYVLLSVKDTGCGMEPEVLDRIFDPYFTTKGEGEGTGLGLATVHGIVQTHHGAISVQSRPRHGTEFTVLLPAATESTVMLDTAVVRRPAPKGSERVLFVDDEISIAQSGKRALESLGYQVVVCSDGAEALEVFLAHPNEFDVVVTDQTMPRLTGIEMAAAMLRMRPELPIILCTGYSEQVNEDGARAAGIRQFIMKPVTCEVLARGIRDAIEGTGSSAHAHGLESGDAVRRMG